KPFSEILKFPESSLLKTEKVTYFLDVPGAESFPDTLIRARTLLDDIDKTHSKDSSIILLTHGDIGKMIWAATNHVHWIKALKEFHFSNVDVLQLDSGTANCNRSFAD